MCGLRNVKKEATWVEIVDTQIYHHPLTFQTAFLDKAPPPYAGIDDKQPSCV